MAALRSLSSPGRTRASLVPQDKGGIVLDIGHEYTKIGFSGEPAPRHIIKSCTIMKPYGEVRYIWDKKYINRDELYLIQCRFLSTIYLQYLMINPRDYRVIVVESLFTPSKFRETLARVLFVHFSVPNVCFLPHHLACLFTLGTLTALVIDIGYNESSVVPVYEGVPLINSTMVTTTATTSIYSSLRQLLLEHGKVEDQVSGKDVPISSVDITQSLLVDIVTKICFVRPLDRGDNLPKDVKYPLNNQMTLVVPGIVRCSAIDVLYQGNDDLSLSECVLESLTHSPIDCRSSFSNNIIVTGGSASIPGLNYRLKEEITRLIDKCNQYERFKSLSFKFHPLLSKPNYTAWQGASIIGSIESASMQRSISREEFKSKEGRLPDWMSCDSQKWETLRQVSPRKPIVSPIQQRKSRTTLLAPGGTTTNN